MHTPNLNQLFGEIEDGVKYFELRAEPVRQEVLDGIFIEGWGYNGSIPGPTIIVNPGDEVCIKVYNELPEKTSIHWHGMDIPQKMDGAAQLQPSPTIEQGDFYEYRFKVVNPPGTHMYHTHLNTQVQQMMGLGGGFIIKDENDEVDYDYFLLLQEFAVEDLEHMTLEKGTYKVDAHSHDFNFYTINGKCFPATTPMKAEEGKDLRIRMGALGHSLHPMHVHGHQFTIENQDGNPLPETMKMKRNSVSLSSGETFEVKIHANNPGSWPFHCHTPHHMANNHTEGHGGMMTSIEYIEK
ncbi:multicopper oxidase family protein [Thalassobacillus hwangdonensis]|uniref:Multicopper oxidase family protein n=1 Tax=Thalassobacillus hwangdonensis TaxID=546108 RepID=A0ABW3L4V0_9BACI